VGLAVLLGVSRQDDRQGVTLAQLNELTERATQEAIQRGIDPDQVEPKVVVRVGGRIRSITFSIG
jgi:hypothetical protein